MDKDTLTEIIGRNITKYRKQAGMTQAQLAELIGVSTAFISRVERGQKIMKVCLGILTTRKRVDKFLDADLVCDLVRL